MNIKKILLGLGGTTAVAAPTSAAVVYKIQLDKQPSEEAIRKEIEAEYLSTRSTIEHDKQKLDTQTIRNDGQLSVLAKIKDFGKKYVPKGWGNYTTYICAWEVSYQCDPILGKKLNELVKLVE